MSSCSCDNVSLSQYYSDTVSLVLNISYSQAI